MISAQRAQLYCFGWATVHSLCMLRGKAVAFKGGWITTLNRFARLFKYFFRVFEVETVLLVLFHASSTKIESGTPF
jgi:hypothetical protein